MKRIDGSVARRRSEPALLTVLAPSDLLSEMVYGIITALAVTNALWFTLGGVESDAIVITATIMINAAWGFSDMIVFLLRSSVDKNAAYSDLHALKEMEDGDAREFIEDNLGGTIFSALDPSHKAKVVSYIHEYSKQTEPVRLPLDKWDYLGAVASMVIYVVSAIPILIPHIFLIGMLTPIILSNIIGVVLMFFIGYVWAGRMRGPRFKSGMILAISGVVMIIVITLVGG
ncbi:MAG: hypothetical protein WC375_03700 [Methanomassiliicoccales archaeon]|jgi:hypothetical protein